MIAGNEIIHEGRRYRISDERPENYDKVITEKYGVWDFRNDGNDTWCCAPPAYWANRKACKKLILIN
jgi:hypothetical protein